MSERRRQDRRLASLPAARWSVDVVTVISGAASVAKQCYVIRTAPHIMVDAGIGRLLVASLHQAIADIAPTRLPFYESWLTPPGIAGGRGLGLAPLHAALSFLRLEGQPTYDQVMRRAGEYSAEWTCDGFSAFRRAAVRRCPTMLRAHWALRLSRQVIAETFRGSRARVRLRRGAGTMALGTSIFCVVRETTEWPMCGFYAALVERVLSRCDIASSVEVGQCRAAGGPSCLLAVTIHGAREPRPLADTPSPTKEAA